MRRPFLLLLTLLAVPGACRPDPPTSGAGDGTERPRRAVGARPADSREARELERLRALGYAEYADARVDPEADPVPLHDAERSQPGYNLFSNRNLCRAQLIDDRGRVLRSWHDPDGLYWSNVELTRAGDLLVVGSGPRPGAPALSQAYLLRLAWDGGVLWKRPLEAHHDVEPEPDGSLLLLTSRFRRIPAVNREHAVREDLVTRLTPQGQVLEEHSLVELLRSAPELFAFAPVEPMTFEDRTYVDLLHANSVERLDDPGLAERDPIYALGNVLVSFRHQDVVAIFDLERGRLVWAWGTQETSGPHDATLLENGNVLLFDNGLFRGWSRVVEVDPLRDAVVWEYRAPEPTDFYSASRGSSQRLENGNTLIANSDSGEAFEVTAEGEVVWRFLNFNADPHGRRATIVRMKRYPADWIEPLLEGGSAASATQPKQE